MITKVSKAINAYQSFMPIQAQKLTTNRLQSIRMATLRITCCLLFFLYLAKASFFTRSARRRAIVNLSSASNSGVEGHLILDQASPNGPVLIRGLIGGLNSGKHGFHVHAKGQLSNDCKDAGPHFNPFKVIFQS